MGACRVVAVVTAAAIVVVAASAIDPVARADRHERAHGDGDDTPAEPAPAWDGAVAPSAGWLAGPGGELYVTVTPREDLVSPRVASLAVYGPVADREESPKARARTQLAVDRGGLWIEEDGAWIAGDHAGPPGFPRDRGTFFDRDTGRSLTVDADGTTCAAWTDPTGECDVDCSWVLCWRPDGGVVRLGGTLAPDGLEYAAAEDGCVATGAAPDVVSFGASRAALTVCTDDAPGATRTRAATCRQLDRLRHRWGRYAGADSDAAVTAMTDAAPTVIVDDDGHVRICADDASDCALALLPPGARVVAAGASADGRVAAAALVDDGGVRLATFDARTGAARREVALADRPTGVRHAGDAIVVEYDDRAELRAARSLAVRAAVGGRRPIAVATPPVRVRGRLWAFASAGGDEVVLQDVRTGKVRDRATLDDSPRRAGTRAWLTMAGDDLVVVYSPLLGDDDRGGGAIIDRDFAVTRFGGPPRCF